MNNPRSKVLTLRTGMALLAWRRATDFPSSRVTTGGQHAASVDTPVKDEALFLDNLPVIDAVIGQVCRRHRLTASESDDFASEVRLHFIERNYEPLRRFEGRSSLRSYLIVVVQHLFLDYRNRLWGRWRPSAEAKRQGPVAILIERLVARDGWSFDEVAETLRTNHGIEIDDTLYALYVKLAQRSPSRQFVAEVEADDVASPTPPPDANVLRAEQDFLAKRVQAALERARQTLAPDERLILRMRFEDSVPVADIARALHLNQKRLYRTIEQILATVRKSLESNGISREEISALFAGGVLSETAAVDVMERDGAAGHSQPAERTRTSWRKS